MTHKVNETAAVGSKPCEFMNRTIDGVYCRLNGGNRCDHAYFCKQCGNTWRLLNSKVLMCEKRAKEMKRRKKDAEN